METPFVFGKIAKNKNFTDRETETKTLVGHFTSLINTIIISPRRWGKSSLVHKAAELSMDRDPALRICKIDLFNVRDEQHFYTLLAKSVLSATSTKWEEFVSDAKRFLSRLMPKISLGPDPANSVSLELDWNEVKENPDEVLDLAEKLAKEKNLKIMICIDEFQNISEFENPDYFQRRLRAHWQTHEHVGYCLYGSKRHMMLEVFTNSSKPFYNFGNLMFLEKIETAYLVEFFEKRFRDTNKSIEPAAALLIASLVENHPYYAQQLAQLAWLRTEEVCTEKIVREAHLGLVEQLSLLFINRTELMTDQQLNYLKAVLSGENTISSTAVMKKYGITSATAAARAKARLLSDDILDNRGGELSFQDPIFAWWLKHEYFRI